jgi:hypothetical protein
MAIGNPLFQISDVGRFMKKTSLGLCQKIILPGAQTTAHTQQQQKKKLKRRLHFQFDQCHQQFHQK